jgi:5'-methylthioadenosine phosphorylase
MVTRILISLLKNKLCLWIIEITKIDRMVIDWVTITRIQMKAIIGGTSLLESSLFKEWYELNVQTPYGEVQVKQAGEFAFLQRHGRKKVPPHAINHQANIWALKTIGVKGVMAINSVGSLKTAIKPKSFVIPDDFMAPWVIPTFFNSQMRFTVPSLDVALSDVFRQLCEQLGVPVKSGGVYVQTTGPRFETKAEINLFRQYADIVGMTMASEATLSVECGVPYASLCSVDNYANGVARKPLTIEEVEESIRSNVVTIELLIRSLLAVDLRS